MLSVDVSVCSVGITVSLGYFNQSSEILSALSSVTRRPGSFDEFLIANSWQGVVMIGRMLHDPFVERQLSPPQLLQ